MHHESQTQLSRPYMHYGIALVLFGVSMFCAIYIIIDLRHPNHSVGDMYGLEVIVRGVPLFLAIGLLFIGLLLVVIGLRKNGRRLVILGHIFILLTTCGMGYLAKGVAQSRREWKERSEYYLKSTEELLHLARTNEDQFAIDALRRPGDAEAVTGLCDLLLDEKLLGRLRVVAAGSLGTLGGEEAKAALTEILNRQPPEYLKTSVMYALENIQYMESNQTASSPVK